MGPCSVGAWAVAFCFAGPCSPACWLRLVHLAPSLPPDPGRHEEHALSALSDLLPTKKDTSSRGHSERPEPQKENGTQGGETESRNPGTGFLPIHKIA